MINENRQDTYRILSKLIKLSFAKYLKGSGIEFGGIYQMKNLNKGNELFLIEVNDIQIRFKRPVDFIVQFMSFLRTNIEDNMADYKRLTNRSVDEFTDEVGLEMRYKQIDYYIYQQTKLFELFRTHFDKIRGTKN